MREARGESFAFLYVDLDNFKIYNDHYSYRAGDNVIKLLAHLLEEATALRGWLTNLSNVNAQGEHYLTDVFEMAAREYDGAHIVIADDPQETEGANDPWQLAQLERAHPELLAEARKEEAGTSGARATGATQEPLPELDLASVIKASRAISGEIELQALLSRLMHIVLENAGAQRGVLVLVRGGQLWVEADASPVPRRLVLTYKHEPLSPQLAATFVKWDFATDLADRSFTFVAPPAAEKIEFEN